jgi:tRNA nucleotidyltransferase (CCA-adding enzyme)
MVVSAGEGAMMVSMAPVNPDELPARFAALPGAQRALAAIAGREEVYTVGGTVRDLLLGGAPRDLDLVVVGDVAGLVSRLGGTARPHPRFGTATVAGPEGARYDLAMARRETYRRPGALPDVAPAGILEDLDRRDFAANALALGLSGSQAGRLLCADHGFEDTLAGTLRVLHPASFRDDPTRLLRLARYGARLGFSTEPGTGRLAREAVQAGALASVSGPRIAAELALAASEPDPVAVWERLRGLGIDEGLLGGLGIAEPGRARKALQLLPRDGDREALLLAAAAGAVPEVAFRAWLDRLGVTAQRRQAALSARGADGLAARLQDARTPAAIVAEIGGAGPEAAALAGAAGAESAARQWLERLRHMDTVLRGEDLIAAGVAPGPAIARGLAAARAARLDGHAPTREAQLAAALRAAQD